MRFSVLPNHYNNQHRYVPTPPGISKQKWPTDLLQRKWFFLPSFIARSRSPFFLILFRGNDFKYRDVFVHMKNEHKNNDLVWTLLFLHVKNALVCTCMQSSKVNLEEKNIFKPKPNLQQQQKKECQIYTVSQKVTLPWMLLMHDGKYFRSVGTVNLTLPHQVQLLLMTIGIFFMSLI